MPGDDGVSVRLQASPGAKRTAIKSRCDEDALLIAGAPPPVNGRANVEVEVVRGSSGRDKTDLVRGIDAAGVRELLSGEVS